MPMFPKIQSPCPYKSRLSAVMEGDFCRMCKRNVFDLTAMDDRERLAFLAGCEEEVCVSYRLPLRPAVAALAAASMAVPAMAQEAAAPAIEAAAEVESIAYDETDLIVVGGIKDPKAVELVEIDDEASVPELPVVYDDEKAPAAVTPSGGI